MTKETGGAAFPESYVGADAPYEGIGGGMTLRDYFAGQALAGFLANSQIAKDAVKEKIGPEVNQAWHAETCYAFADALLKERGKQ